MDALRLLQVIAASDHGSASGKPIEPGALKSAHGHRLGLPFLTALAADGQLDQLEGEYQRRISEFNQLHADIRALQEALARTGCRYVFLKTLRLYAENPNDIDLLVFDDLDQCRDSLSRAVGVLGYEPYVGAGHNTYNFGRAGKLAFRAPPGPARIHRKDLDIYGEMMVEEYVFGDKSILEPYIDARPVSNRFDGTVTDVPLLRPGAELFVIYWHSLFPTRRLGLEVVFTTLHSLQVFSERDYRDFGDLASRSGLVKPITYCVETCINTLQQVLPGVCEPQCRLLLAATRSSRHPSEVPANWPTVVPTSLFFLTALAGLRFKKGVQSAAAVIAKCVYPPYLLNILRETFLVSLGTERYRLKH